LASDVKKMWVQVRGKPNVVGYAPRLVKRIKAGRVRRGWVFRVYVSRKLPKNMLGDGDVIPREIGGVPVDVVELRRYFKDEIIYGSNVAFFDSYYATCIYALSLLLLLSTTTVFSALWLLTGIEECLTCMVAGLVTSIPLSYLTVVSLSMRKVG